MKSFSKGFTWIEILVCLVVVGVLIALVMPSLARRGDSYAEPLIKMSQLHIALASMELDNFTEGKNNHFWIASNAPIPTVEQLTNTLVTGGYLSASDMRKILRVKSSENGFTFYAVADSDPAETIFISTKNWHGPFAPLSGEPYGNKGFAIMRKGGDGQIYQAHFATNTNVGGRGLYNFLPLK